jgi:hypothetical protein
MGETQAAAVQRNGSGTSEMQRTDLTTMAGAMLKRRRALKSECESDLESAILKVRELRLAGMMNKAGADEIQQRLLVAWSKLEQL